MAWQGHWEKESKESDIMIYWRPVNSLWLKSTRWSIMPAFYQAREVSLSVGRSWMKFS